MRNHTPAFGIHIPEDLYWAIADEATGAWADSYTFGAQTTDGRFLPRTLAAWERIREHRGVMALLEDRGLRLVKPAPFAGTQAHEILGIPKPEYLPRRRAA